MLWYNSQNILYHHRFLLKHDILKSVMYVYLLPVVYILYLSLQSSKPKSSSSSLHLLHVLPILPTPPRHPSRKLFQILWPSWCHLWFCLDFFSIIFLLVMQFLGLLVFCRFKSLETWHPLPPLDWIWTWTAWPDKYSEDFYRKHGYFILLLLVILIILTF